MAPYRRPPDAPEEVEQLDLTPPRVDLPLLGRIWRATLLGRSDWARFQMRWALVKDAKQGLMPRERVAALWAATASEGRRREPAYEALMALWREDYENRTSTGEPKSWYEHDIHRLLRHGLESIACDALVVEFDRTLTQALTGDMAYATRWQLKMGAGEEVDRLRRLAAQVAIAGRGLLEIGDDEEIARVHEAVRSLPPQWKDDRSVGMLKDRLAEATARAPTEDDLAMLARMLGWGGRAQSAAHDGLKRLGGVGAVQALLGARSDPRVRRTLVELAANVDIAAFARLREKDDYWDVDLYIRILAAADVPVQDELDYLVGNLVRWVSLAGERLAELGGPRALAALVAQLEVSSSPRELNNLVGQLAQLGDPAALGALRAFRARGFPEDVPLDASSPPHLKALRRRERAEADAQLEEVIERLERRAEQQSDPR